jgi:hypothetical protein
MFDTLVALGSRRCRQFGTAVSSRHAEAAGPRRYWWRRQFGSAIGDGAPSLLAESHATGNIEPATCESGHR